MIRIAVVTPSHNQGEFIERTIRSVLDQNYPDLEYVVCDAESGDATPAILEAYADRLQIIREPDRGQADAVNKGIRVTSGDVIGWLNSDDVYYPGALATVAGFFGDHPDVDVLYGDADFIDAWGAVIGRYYTRAWDAERLKERPFLCQPAVFFRRRMVDRFGLLDEQLQYTLDYEYWLRLAAGGAHFAYLPVTLAGARLHSATKTRNGRLKLHAELHPMLKRYVRKVPDGWILSHTQAHLQDTPGLSFSTPLAFALAVAGTSLRLSLELNHSVSTRLALSTARTLSAGLLKTLRRRPVVFPLD
ncbi:MAG: glycosyltransferase [Chloroflexota bacterium]|nr:glycosyltransferase [Chloroflexota bacterium]